MDNKNVWRDRRYPYDHVSREDLAVSTHSIRAEDEVAKQGPFRLTICHMLTFSGEGFEAFVRTTRGLKRCCSCLHRGRDQAAYDKAKEEGVTFLKELVARLESKPPRTFEILW